MSREEHIEKWLNGSLSAEELEQFKQSADYRALVALDQALDAYKAPDFDVEAALKTVQERKAVKEAKVISLFNRNMFIRVAAVVVLAIFGYLLIFNSSETTIKTTLAEKTEVKLPDQSGVWLNASSKLTYDVSAWPSERIVELQGEAYFKVNKGSKFDVLTEDGIVTVLGTQFNVKARAKFFEVDCFEGQVAVIVKRDTIHLLAGKGVRIIEGKQQLLQVEGSGPAWTRNESTFDSVHFAEVLAEFERQYDVRIETKNVDLTKYYSGSFTHNDFDIALQSIASPLNLTIEKTTEKHIILSNIAE
jgi:transmembrane sensor